MSVLFRNESSTCFFNVAMQMLLASPAFRRATRVEYAKTCGSESDVRPRRVCLDHFFKIVSCLESLTSPSAAFVTSVRSLAPLFPVLANSLQTHRMHDVFECLDNIFDVLGIEGSMRPTLFNTLEDAVASLDAHMGSFAAVWSVSCETHVCTKCARTTHTYTPCLYVSRVSDTSTISDARCEGCGEVHPRTVRWELARPGETVFVRVNRHTSTGAKRHDRVCLNEGVTLRDRVYSMRAMVYHDGITLDGGHYTCAFKSVVSGSWVLNSDTHARFAGSSFDVSTHDAHKTYGATYSM